MRGIVSGGWFGPLTISGDVFAMILGLTGGIASGKSSVADFFVECGALLVSADSLAREVVNPGSPTLAKPGRCLR